VLASEIRQAHAGLQSGGQALDQDGHQSWRSPEAKELLEHGRWLPSRRADTESPAYQLTLGAKHPYDT
jgi:hypothetical protein